MTELKQFKDEKMVNDAYQNLVDSDEKNQVGIDFDGVIHKNTHGFHDGTIYDEPIEGSLEAIKQLSQKFKIIVFTCKARHDRVKVNGKTGTELVWEWLNENGFGEYVAEVTAEKPRAAFYIDDKGYRFHSWSNMMETLKEQW